PVRRRYKYTAKNPPATGTASINGPATAESRNTGTPARTATRTAVALRKLMGASTGGGGAVGNGARIDCTSGGSSTAINSSRCGLPHLWQNRASSGSCAPQVQYSGTL